MKYISLGNFGIRVSQIALGTWGLGGGSVWSDRESDAVDAASLLDACRERGINYIDTAPVYGTGLSEELLGKALKGRRSDFVLQTKCSLNWRNEGGYFHYERDGFTVNNDTRPEAVRRDVEDSLRRLQTDYLDSLVVHYVTDRYPVEDTVGALEDLKKEGKIRAYGLSNSQPKDLEAYQAAGGQTALVQEFFSILSPFHGRAYFESCSRYQTVFQTYGALEEGYLTSPEFLDRRFKPSDIRSRLPWAQEACREQLRRAFEEWRPLTEKHGCSYAALMEAWCLAQKEDICLLIGMRRPATVEDTAASTEIRLSPDEIAMMEDAVRDMQVPVLDK